MWAVLTQGAASLKVAVRKEQCVCCAETEPPPQLQVFFLWSSYLWFLQSSPVQTCFISKTSRGYEMKVSVQCAFNTHYVTCVQVVHGRGCVFKALVTDTHGQSLLTAELMFKHFLISCDGLIWGRLKNSWVAVWSCVFPSIMIMKQSTLFKSWHWIFEADAGINHGSNIS